LIQNSASLGVPVASVIDQLAATRAASIRQASILSLGEFDNRALPAPARANLLPNLQAIYRNDPDPGVHAAAEWLLRRWSAQDWLQAETERWMANKAAREEWFQFITKTLLNPSTPAERQWYVNGQGQTMVVLPGPVDFQMGSPRAELARREDEKMHTRRMVRSFALAATSVTREQFLRFMPELAQGDLKRFPSPACPIGGVLWAEAAAYCNWLSKQEGIPQDQWCYEVLGEEVKAKDNCLRLAGYRLPTEAEMECATRAGTTTSRSFGESDEYLPNYAWFEGNSQDRTWPVGSLLPNDFGFFDTLGNVYTWCHECYRPYPEPDEWGVVEDTQIHAVGDVPELIALRGGAYFNRPATLRSATRYSALSTYRNDFYGLRPARTLVPK
jgi:formylglycine-generating enzyme required for sulfatase activity